MKYLSLCSGIEAASVAWGPLGWEPVAFSEIEKFPCKLLEYRFPKVPNIGDMTKIDGSKYRGAVDLIVGGTPCQGFCIGGKRGGLSDQRSGLALHFVRIVSECRPRWFVWENVTGAFSTNGGRDFGSFVRALDECGYHIAWRVLDAQFFGTPQRRHRFFLVGHSGDWRYPAAVLFEREGLRRDFEKGRSSGENYPCLTSKGAQALDDRTPFCLEKEGPRRLTPLEWERLQGFPDGWTDIPGASDTARYKAIGNSMAIPVMRWLGDRIDKVNKANFS